MATGDAPVDAHSAAEPEAATELPTVAEPLTGEPEAPADLPRLLAEIESRLLSAFEEKLAIDSHKDKQIDRLHDELQAYKSDLVAKAIRPMVSTLIQVHADAVRLVDTISKQEPDKLTAERIAALFDSFRLDIETALIDQGIRPFREPDGARFDPRRQSAASTVKAPAELVGAVSHSLGWGFEQQGEVVEREPVAVFVLENPNAAQA
jgi:molecular chaperone GrpE (heat shock protein)